MDNCDVPNQFSHLQWVDFFNEDGFEKIEQAIRAGVSQRQPLESRVFDETNPPSEHIIKQLDYNEGSPALADQALRETIARCLDYLPEQERLVLSLYYYEGLTMKEIGKVLELTESRIAQIHTKAILRVRKMMAGEPFSNH